jgi:hypothetical protein
MSSEFQKGLYDVSATVSINPYGVINNLDQVELRIGDVFVGIFPTYTRAAEELIFIINES